MTKLSDSDVQILCALNAINCAYANVVASNNYSLAASGIPGSDPNQLLQDPAYRRLYQEALSRDLINVEGGPNA